MSSVYIAHIELLAPNDTPVNLHVSSEPIRPIPSGDATAPNRTYDPILIEPANVQRSLFGDITRGGGERGYGLMKLSNARGDMNVYRTYKFGAVQVLKYVSGSPLSSAIPVFTGVVSTPSWTHSARSVASLNLRVQDDFKILDRELIVEHYAGTAGSGDILEGDVDLEGVGKPLLYGDLSDGHVPGVLISAASQIYQIGANGFDSLNNIFDRGAAAGYADDGDMTEAAFLLYMPLPGRYGTHKAKGLVKLGTPPVGKIGFRVTQASGQTPRSVIKALLLNVGIPAGKISADFDLAGGPNVGGFIQQEASFESFIRFLARAESAAVGPDASGIWRYSLLDDPKVIADYDLLFDDILDLTPDGDASQPIGRVRVGYRRNNLVLSTTETNAAANINFITHEWRYAESNDAAVQARYPDFITRTVETPIRGATAAKVRANTLLRVLGPRAEGDMKEQLRLVMPHDDARATLALGSTVHIDYPPGGIDRNYVLTGVELTRPKRRQMIWRLWG